MFNAAAFMSASLCPSKFTAYLLKHSQPRDCEFKTFWFFEKQIILFENNILEKKFKKPSLKNS